LSSAASATPATELSIQLVVAVWLNVAGPHIQSKHRPGQPCRRLLFPTCRPSANSSLHCIQQPPRPQLRSCSASGPGPGLVPHVLLDQAVRSTEYRRQTRCACPYLKTIAPVPSAANLSLRVKPNSLSRPKRSQTTCTIEWDQTCSDEYRHS
jgi:hypothetical protein